MLRIALVVTLAWLAVSSCGSTPPAEGALDVAIDVEGLPRARCVVLHAQGAQGDGGVDTKALAWSGAPLHVGIGPAAFGNDVVVQARAFADPGCAAASWLASSEPHSARIVPGQVTHLYVLVKGSVEDGGQDAGEVDAGAEDAGPLDAGPQDAGPGDAGPPDAGPLDAGPQDAGTPDAGPFDAGPPTCATVTCAPGTQCVAGACLEADCTDGVDNDGDGKLDCVDQDCSAKACDDHDLCTAGETCVNSTCTPASTTQCQPGTATCRSASGTCDPATGNCRYAPLAATTSCNDTLSCTTGDQCDGDGGCVATPLVCPLPPANGCFQPTVTCQEPSGACPFTVNLAGSCTDGNNCTTTDHCLADGGCAGTPVTCTPPVCKTFGGVCSAAGACQFDNATDGTVCSGGSCQGGVCVPTPVNLFSYTPSNFTEAQMPRLDGGHNLVINCTATLDTGAAGAVTTASLCGAALPPSVAITQSGGVPAVLMALDGFAINSGSRLTVRGARPLILAVAGSVNIAGVLDVSGGVNGAGAGANVACSGSTGGNGGTGGTGSNGGGGGAGFGTSGTAGGYVYNTTGGGGTAGQSGGGASLVPLRGGCNGGAGGDWGANTGGSGGNAGGAVQLSASGSLAISGTISSAGQGGRGGSGNYGGGGGGASGGAILLEGTDVSWTPGAKVTANGGAGGSIAGNGNGSAGADGADGHTTDSFQALPGSLGPGSGGSRLGAPTAVTYIASGGGGAVGRIRINSPNACVGSSLGPVFSPQPTSSAGANNCTP